MTDLTDLGIEPTGGDPIGAVVQEAAADGQLLFLPPGEYRIEDGIDLSGLERFGIIGDGATIIPMDDASGALFYIGGEGAVHIQNLQFDFRGADTGVRALDIRAPDDLVIRDVSVSGELEGGRGPVRVDVTDSDGSGIVERLRLPDGSAADEPITGCYVGDDNRGEITFKDCHIVGFGDNGLYADPAVGRIIVDGGYYANNGIANVRVRADCVVRNVHVRCDDASSEFENMRGIRLTNFEADPDSEPPIVENCLVEMLGVPSSDGGITVSSEIPSATIRNTEIRIDADNVNGIWAKMPADELTESASNLWVDCQGVTVTGSADNGFAVKIDGRGGCTLEGIEVTQAASNRNGIGFQRSHDNVLRDATVDVGGIPILLQNASVETIDTNVEEREIHSTTEDEDE
ncbi:hypothetical protein [Halobellus captivus]|uniref:hypothetical protein n=1 Tax=Halobellus captivus TaxID=2592614 RepID=UPI0011A98449|nr:hypothetical protein [Halobellus captivus]